YNIPVLFLLARRQRRATLFPYTTLFRSGRRGRWMKTRHWRRSARREQCGLSSEKNARRPASKIEAGLALPHCSRLRTHFHVTSRSEEHTSELQSRENLVCRLLLEKKKNT